MEALKFTDLADLPAALDLMTAARALGLGHTKAYALAQQGQFPCRVIKIGDKYTIPVKRPEVSGLGPK